MEDLALNGGLPVLTDPLPKRRALGDLERRAVVECLDYYQELGEDLPYLGVYSSRFSAAFDEFLGGGRSFACSSGTAAIYIAFEALDLARGSLVAVSPVTDVGPISALLALGLIPVLVDSKARSWNIGAEQLDRALIGKEVKALLLTHAGGEPSHDIDEIVDICDRRNIVIVEDVAQSPGGRFCSGKSCNTCGVGECRGRLLGTIGAISCWSTMYRKSLISGSQGGIVSVKEDDRLSRRVMASIDKGKPVWRTDLDLRDPNHCIFPGLNWMQDELSCAIATASLARLKTTVEKRLSWTKMFVKGLGESSVICSPYALHDGFSPFFFSIFVDEERLKCSKEEYATALQSEGVGLGVRYGCVVSSWGWLARSIGSHQSTPNAEATRDSSFNLYLNENYKESDAELILSAIKKVDKAFEV